MVELTDAVVIPRSEHGISRDAISKPAIRVLEGLAEAGFDAHLVGGAVRDLLIGGHPKDFDIATDARPEQVRQVFRNCRLIGRRFRLAHVHFGREIIEVATYRSGGTEDGGAAGHLDADGRIVRDNVYGNIAEDAIRRDFTANALYYSLGEDAVRDFVGGYGDVRARRLELIGDVETRYREDPVRMLRAVRLAAKLGFEIDEAAANGIHRLGPLLANVSNARLFDEFLKVFLTGHGVASFDALGTHGLTPILLPETAQALATDETGLCRDFIRAGLANSDRRVADGRSVTPAFLFAVLLWPAYAQALEKLLADGADLPIAEQRAADRVILHQCGVTAIPRRFSTPLREIWWMQSRFPQRQKKRVFRTLEHPRFRAAYDFLEMRARVVPELTPEFEFWREAQELEPAALAARVTASSDGKVRRGRGRRRRRSRGGAGNDGDGHDSSHA